MCAKNLCKRTVLVQLIIKNAVTCFLGTQCNIKFQIKTKFWTISARCRQCRLFHICSLDGGTIALTSSL